MNIKLLNPSLLLSASNSRALISVPMAATGKRVAIDRTYEESIAKGSYKHIVGCDEAGRGPLAGPVTAAAVYIQSGTYIENVMDSKKFTSEHQREKLYDEITSHPHVQWSVVNLDNTVIDEMNILEASLKAMQLAISEVVDRIPASSSEEGILALVDGNKEPKDMHPSISTTMTITKGDSACYSIAAASILAKVTRDRIMNDLHVKYPHYGFLKNKGYPTVEHRKALSTHGPSCVHRISYKPVKDAMEKHGMKNLPPPFTPHAKPEPLNVVTHRTNNPTSTETQHDIHESGNGRILRSRKRLLYDFLHEQD